MHAGRNAASLPLYFWKIDAACPLVLPPPRSACSACQAQPGLTAMELQRLEQIARNRERLMALNLPSLAAELMPAPPPKAAAGAKHKGGWVGGLALGLLLGAGTL